ncbi:MAG: AIR synthase-related protein [Thermodesulfobacteriota bacterium]|nr:AIR synthase-related protein [Thermodesulfobacteriota bacterium]
MPHQLEITLKPDLPDAEGETVKKRASDYLGTTLEQVRVIHVLTIDADLTPAQCEQVQRIFTNPVTQISAFSPLPVDFDWTIWVGFRPGVKDNPGDTARETISEALGIAFKPGQGIYTSRRYCLQAHGLDVEATDRIAAELLANDTIEQWKVLSISQWRGKGGIGVIVPKVQLDHTPTAATIPIESDAALLAVSRERNLALNPNDVPTIRDYFLREAVQAERRTAGLAEPTDIELEYISQVRSDHCNHNTFGGYFRYRDLETGDVQEIDSLFATCIKNPTLALQQQKSWVVSVLWDNAGAARFDDDHCYVITGETHNSPSNMEAYGGAMTGIVGVYRDPMGTGKGARLVMGGYGFCAGYRDYDGDLKPKLHPRRLLDGVIEGVKDGGNKSGIPTTFGQVYFDDGYMGKCLVFVTAIGIMPVLVQGEPAHEKRTSPGDRIVMCGGRVGKDGIHGVTASSEVYSDTTPAGHVQIGDPYTQKKMHDFLLCARDEGLIRFITDNGGGGLSSSVGESAVFAGGCEVWLEKVPLKYEGLDQWEIWVSESQERMTVAVAPEHIDRFFALSADHAVESTVIGHYTDSGKLHIMYDGRTCAYIDLDFMQSDFPQWQFEAEWTPPALRGLCEPVLNSPRNYNRLLCDMLARPNIGSREWIVRQYDHEVQGGSVIKPLVGKDRDVASDAAVTRPVLASERAIAFSQALLPAYSQIDAYHMATCTIDEAVRRVIAVGAPWDAIGGVDNFCWPNIQYDPVTNPDGRFKAAQLVRSCLALRDACEAFGIPLLSGKDSMYVDGHLAGRYEETRKVSALPTMQFSATAVVPDVSRCVTMDVKAPGDFVYIVGVTADELGASEYYAHLGFIGQNVPQVNMAVCRKQYAAVSAAIAQQCLASTHGIYRGGLGIHIALVAMGGMLGMTIDLANVPCAEALSDDRLLFSESPGRFIVTIAPNDRQEAEALFDGCAFACVGMVTDEPVLRITGGNGGRIVETGVDELKQAWKRPFGDLI